MSRQCSPAGVTSVSPFRVCHDPLSNLLFGTSLLFSGTSPPGRFHGFKGSISGVFTIGVRSWRQGMTALEAQTHTHPRGRAAAWTIHSIPWPILCVSASSFVLS